MKIVAFFNIKGGVGKTSLVYHLAWMFAELGIPVLAADLDPQANLTSMFLGEERLLELWPEDAAHVDTVLGAIEPILSGMGDIRVPESTRIHGNLWLLPGDLGLSRFEDKLSDAWPRCLMGDEASFRVMTAFHRIMDGMAGSSAALVLVDVGPNLGAINRAALIASDTLVLPLAPDLYSLQGMKNLGPTLAAWRKIWTGMKASAPRGLSIPTGSIHPSGYVILQHGMRDNRPVKAYLRWMDRIPRVYREAVLQDAFAEPSGSVADDAHCLAVLKHYRSLMPLAMEANKPMFHLKPADGAIGAHVEAVRDCRVDFERLARRVASAIGLEGLC
ncbi:MAG: ParA family protein [Bryobacterales bacterium]|nr:ParA family protein [Bryobacterales bacterium]